jgi:hypothetical protein
MARKVDPPQDLARRLAEMQALRELVSGVPRDLAERLAEVQALRKLVRSAESQRKQVLAKNLGCSPRRPPARS